MLNVEVDIEFNLEFSSKSKENLVLNLMVSQSCFLFKWDEFHAEFDIEFDGDLDNEFNVKFDAELNVKFDVGCGS